MAEHPLNLAFRFVLEIAALVALAIWGWAAQPGPMRWVLAVAAPLIAATLWGTFRVRELHNQKEPPVLVAGWVRLLLEAAFFAAAVAGLWDADYYTPAWLLGAAVSLHYAVSYDRIARLLRG